MPVGEEALRIVLHILTSILKILYFSTMEDFLESAYIIGHILCHIEVFETTLMLVTDAKETCKFFSDCNFHIIFHLTWTN